MFKLKYRAVFHRQSPFDFIGTVHIEFMRPIVAYIIVPDKVCPDHFYKLGSRHLNWFEYSDQTIVVVRLVRRT